MSGYRCPDEKYRGCDFLGCDRKIAARLRGELLARCDVSDIADPVETVDP